KGIPWVSPNEVANVNALCPSSATTRLIGRRGRLAYDPATGECCRRGGNASDLKQTTTMNYGENLVSGLLRGPLFFLILLCHEHFLRDSELPIIGSSRFIDVFLSRSLPVLKRTYG